MRLNALKKQKRKVATKRARNESSLDIENTLNHSAELADNSIAEMFDYLEKQYKKDA